MRDPDDARTGATAPGVEPTLHLVVAPDPVPSPGVTGGAGGAGGADGGAGGGGDDHVVVQTPDEPGIGRRVVDVIVDPSHRQTERIARFVGPVFAVCAVALVPWAAYMYVVLPGRALSHHYDLAWAGFDVGLGAALLATTWALVRLSRALPIAASALGTMLVVDAWFDVLTSRPGGEHLAALAMAALVELPLAAVAYWMAYHGQALRERAIVVRLVRASREGVLTRSLARRLVRRGPRERWSRDTRRTDPR